MLSADATRLAQLTKNFIKNTTTSTSTKKKADSTLELAALQSNITKREIIMDEDPDIVLKMGGKEAQLQQEKVKKAEEVYRFARQVLDIVDNSNDNDDPSASKKKVKRGLNTDKGTNRQLLKKTTNSANIKGIWAGLGSIPEFEPDLVRRDTLTHDSQESRELLKTSKPQHYHHTMSLQEIRQKRDEFNNIPRHYKRAIAEDDNNMADHDHYINKVKRSNPPQPSLSRQQHIESPVSVTETGSLGTVNFREVRKDTITNAAEDSSPTHDNIKQHMKTKRQETDTSTSNNDGIINRMTTPTTSNDGKVIFAFDEVKELLPARLSQIIETDGRGQVSLLKPKTITETRYDDVDKDLAESMLVSRENIPSGQTGRTAVLTAQLYPELSSPSTLSVENQQQKNKIPILKKENRIGPAQFSKYRSNYERPRMEQMQRWINETMLHPLGNEQTEETDAALQKLNLASLNTSSPYPSYIDSKGETSSEYLAKNLQDKVKTEESNSEVVGVDELNRDILKEQGKYKAYLEKQRLERLRDQQKQQNGDDSETQSQSTQNLSNNSTPSSSVKQQKQNTTKENELEHLERVHNNNNNTVNNELSSTQQQQQQHQGEKQEEKVIDKEGTLEHFERVHNNNNSSVNNELSPSSQPNATTISTPTQTTTNTTMPTSNTTSQANTTTITTKNTTIPVNATSKTPTTPSPTPPTTTTITLSTQTTKNLTNNNQTQQQPLEQQQITNNSNNTLLSQHSYQQPELNHENVNSSTTTATAQGKKNETSINRDNVEPLTNPTTQQQQQTTLTPAQQYLDAWQQGNATNLPVTVTTTPQPQQTTILSPLVTTITTTTTTATTPPTTSTASHEIQTKVHPYPLDTEYEMELPRNKSAPSIIPRSDGKLYPSTHTTLF